MSRVKLALIIFLILKLDMRLFAAPTGSLQIFLDQVQMTHKRNKQLCYAFEDETPGLPCNPSFLAIQREAQVWISGFGNNNLSYFEDVSDIIKGPINTDLLLSMINHNSNEHFIASLSLGYMQSNWGFNVIPEKLILFTKIRNPSLPRITLLAAKESEFQWQIGSFINTEWSWGLQLRALQRRFAYNDTYFSDHFIEGSNNLYPIQHQQLYFIEPSILFTPEDQNWNPTFSLMIDNWGTTDEKHEPFDTDPNLRIGSSISLPLDFGRLQLGITTHWLNEESSSKFYSSMGANLSLSHFQVFATIGEVEQQYGLALNFNHFTSALSYSRQDWANNQLADSYTIWKWEFGFKF